MLPGLKWQIIAVTFFRLSLNTARRFVYPFAPALSRDLDVPLSAITSLIALNNATGLLGIATGPLADRWGCRNMMRTGLALLAVGMLLCAAMPAYGVVLVGLFLAGMGKIVFDPAVQAFVGHRIAFKRRGLAIGAIETAWAGSTLIGIPLTALLINQFGLRWSFMAMALLGALGFFVLVRVLPPDNASASNPVNSAGFISVWRQLIRERAAVAMLGVAFWISMANDNLFVVYGIWLEHDFGVGLLALGLSTTVIGAAELTGESFTAVGADKFGLKRSIAIGLILAIASYAMLPFISASLYPALLGLFLVFLSYELVVVCSFSLSTELMPASRATMMAAISVAMGLGRMMGALIGTPLWFYGGLKAVTFTSAATTLLALACFVWGVRHWDRGIGDGLKP
jgi:MFS transporter, DHA1 family, inner membrane transport protein